MPNYLQFIGSADRSHALSPVRFLVSGVDPKVRKVIGEHIVASAFSRGLTLFILDNTHSGRDFTAGLGGYRVVNGIADRISLCRDLLDVGSLQGISRLRTLLAEFGFSDIRAMKVVQYLLFVKETEQRLGHQGDLTAEILEQYGGTMLVKWKLDQLLTAGRLSEENYNYLVGRYGEVADAAADFESCLTLLAPFLGGVSPSPHMAVVLPVGEFSADRLIQSLMCKLLLYHMKEPANASAVLVLDDGAGAQSCIIDMVRGIPAATEIHILSDDIFSHGEAERGAIMNLFPVRVYTRHESMSSCENVEKLCGEINVVKRSRAVAVDRRWRSNSAWDMLMGTNKTETEIANAQVREPLFRKEYVQTLPLGTGIVDHAGNKVLFSF